MGMGMGMGKGKGKGGDEEDTSTEDLQRFYKRKCNANSVVHLKTIDEKFAYVFDEGEGILE